MLLKICLILSGVVVFSGCKGDIPPPPEISYIYEVDLDTPACARFEVKSQDPLVIVYDQDLPITACNGYVGIPPKDSQNLFNWINDIQRKK